MGASRGRRGRVAYPSLSRAAFHTTGRKALPDMVEFARSVHAGGDEPLTGCCGRRNRRTKNQIWPWCAPTRCVGDEDFHLTWKQGCRSSNCSWRRGSAEKALVLYAGGRCDCCVCGLARRDRRACTEVLTDEEWQALFAHATVKRRRRRRPCRPSNRPPNGLVVWRSPGTEARRHARGANLVAWLATLGFCGWLSSGANTRRASAGLERRLFQRATDMGRHAPHPYISNAGAKQQVLRSGCV